MSDILYSSTPAQDVASILSSLGYGTIGVDIFVWKEPDDSALINDNIMTIYDTGFYNEPQCGYTYEYSSIQVRVRRKGGDQRSSRSKVMELMNALHGYTGTVGSINYRLIKVINGIVDLGEDDRGRLRWTFNCEIQRN